MIVYENSSKYLLMNLSKFLYMFYRLRKMKQIFPHLVLKKPAMCILCFIIYASTVNDMLFHVAKIF